MQDKMNENISQFLDAELNQQQTITLLKEIRNDSELKNKIIRYHTVRQVLRSEDSLLAKVDLVDKVQLQIKQEPIHFIPPAKKRLNWQQTSLALAASIAIVAVVVPNVINRSVDNNNIAVIAELDSQEDPFVAVKSEQQPGEDKASENHRRLKEYLQAHNDFVSSGAFNYQPYVQRAGFNQ